MKKSYLYLMLILVFAAILYTYKLAEIPNGFYVDEAVVGYNAYSILQTGNDEYGKFLPAAFRFFGSYTPPLNVYLLTPIIALFDLSVFSVRLLSVICGLLMIVVIYLFIKNLGVFKNKLTPIIGALLFSILPWTVLYTRTGYEVFLGLTVLSLGSLLSYLSLKNKSFIIPALITLPLSAYTAHSQKYLIPLFVIGFILIFAKLIFKKENIKHLIIGTVLGLLIQIPNISFLLSPAFLIKGDLFYIDPILKTAATLPSFVPQPIAYIYGFIREFLSQYLTYFSPRSLFISPDPDLQRSLPDLSVFYTWMVIPYLLGLYILWQTRKEVGSKFLMLLLLVTPIPAAITGDPFSTQRGLSLLLPLSLVVILGVDQLLTKFKPQITLPIGTLLILISLLFLWRSYFILLPLERANAWSYGFSNLANYIQSHPKQQFIIDQYQIKPAYIELAFFLKYPPQNFQEELIDKSIKDHYYTKTTWNSHYKFGNIVTRQINYATDLCLGNVLVGDITTFSPSDITENNLTEVVNIKNPKNETIFIGYEVMTNDKCN